MAIEKFKEGYIVWGRPGKDRKKYYRSGAFCTVSDPFTEHYFSPILFWVVMIFFGGGGLFLLGVLVHPRCRFIVPGSAAASVIREEREKEREAVQGRFDVNEWGFVMPAEKGPLTYSWSEVCTLFGFKQDLITIDEITLDVFLQDGQSFRLTESMGCWDPFLNALYKQFPSVNAGWEGEVMLPAFRKNMTLLYDRQGRSLTEAETDCYR